ncbi:AI-2E family transporter [Streptosporangium saharense]|uniref:Putative PurR-regulated permease PerM n=1 Tax=Streptosporangium saharense TaxID=1706840 RepID=A0A7W7QHI6_9ACTN|nr:AI-2E family transporter [Streptosporangium saharense]MBB4913638.1 putative PurR-regulated permease PerM [Streptosporangium saharense]
MPVKVSVGFRTLTACAAAVIVLWGTRQLSAIVAPAFLALTLTIAVSPLRDRLRGWAAAFVPLAVILLALCALGAAMVVSVARFVALVPRYADQYRRLLSSVGTALRDLGVDQSQIRNALSGIDPDRIVRAAQSLLSGFAGTVSAVVVTILVLYGMSLDAVVFRRTTGALVAQRPDLVTALRGFARDTCSYLVVCTVFGLIVAVLDTAVLALLGVPLPLLWGLLSFITNYIPNVGFVIGLVPPAVLALLDSGVATMVWVVVAYCVLNFVIQSVIQPKFAGQSAHLSVTVTMLSLFVWTWALGALGAILAVPLSSFARAVLLDADPATAWASPLVTGTDPGHKR